MRMKFFLALCLGGLSGVALAADAPAAPVAASPAATMTEVPLRQVKLYTSGAGYFEHAGHVQGNAATKLVFGAEQMNSLLKTFVVRDFDGGSVDDISYPAPTPLSEVLGAFSIDVAAVSSRYQLLQRLRGERVRFFPADGGAEFSATVLGVEKLASHQHLPVEVVNIIRDNGEVLGQSLSSIRHFVPENPALVKELGQALTALASARNDTHRPFTLNFNGKGDRRVAFGYVLDMPVWKPTYRLTVNENGKDAFLQGWALVENRTDFDWNKLQLSLVAGKPNKMNVLLYDYDNGNPSTKRREIKQVFAAEAAELALDAAGADAVAPQAFARSNKAARFNGASSQRQVTAREMGEMFAYDVAAPVTLARRQATMLEIIGGNIPAEKVLYFHPGKMAANPDNALYLKNNSGKVMLAGPVAVFDEGYGGDANLEHLAADGETLVRYSRALDVKEETHPQPGTSVCEAVKFHRGVLEVKRKETTATRYVFRNPGKKAFTLLLDIPQRPGWTLADGLKPWKDENHVDTFRVAIPAGKDTEFVHRAFRVASESYLLTNAGHWGIVSGICASGALTADQKAAWAKAGELRAKVEEVRKRVSESEAGLKELTDNQERTRKNLNSLADRQSDFYRQLVARLAEEIKQTDARQQEIKQRRAELRDAEKAFNDYLMGLEL
ncbi:MAG: hypothetical protein J6333_05990 [Planctomycetes bacterium]|nr:hypothetical protein [Planctomycetota bacterium]